MYDMVVNFKMLGVFMENRICGNMLTSFVIAMERDGKVRYDIEFQKQKAKPF